MGRRARLCHLSGAVYAIGVERTNGLIKRLPFFSKINLCNHAHLIRDLNIAVAVAPIRIVYAVTSPQPMMPHQQGKPGQGTLFARPDGLP